MMICNQLFLTVTLTLTQIYNYEYKADKRYIWDINECNHITMYDNNDDTCILLYLLSFQKAFLKCALDEVSMTKLMYLTQWDDPLFCPHLQHNIGYYLKT